MILNSSISITEQDAPKTSVYSEADGSENIHIWIYSTQSSLINGIYVQTIPLNELIKQDAVTNIESELAAMAVDPDIQREISLINAEFAETEWDGLAKDS